MPLSSGLALDSGAEGGGLPSSWSSPLPQTHRLRSVWLHNSCHIHWPLHRTHLKTAGLGAPHQSGRPVPGKAKGAKMSVGSRSEPTPALCMEALCTQPRWCPSVPPPLAPHPLSCLSMQGSDRVVHPHGETGGSLLELG